MSIARKYHLPLQPVREFSKPQGGLSRGDELQDSAKVGIGTLIHYLIPPHVTGSYAKARWKPGDFPIAEEIANTELSLPLSPHLEAQQQEMAIQAIRQLC